MLCLKIEQPSNIVCLERQIDMVAMVQTKTQVARFPEEQINAALIQFWKREALDRADDPFAPVPKIACTLYELLPALDSLTIVRSFLVIEQILEFPVPVALVKPGGYYSQE